MNLRNVLIALLIIIIVAAFFGHGAWFPFAASGPVGLLVLVLLVLVLAGVI